MTDTFLVAFGGAFGIGVVALMYMAKEIWTLQYPAPQGLLLQHIDIFVLD